MSLYFDEVTAKIADASQYADDDFLDVVIAEENRASREAQLLCGDREFPDDLREKIMGIIAVWQLDPGPPFLASRTGLNWVLMFRQSRLVQELHIIFHEVAERRIETRFGLLFDDPGAAVRARDAHDTGQPIG